MSTAMNRPALVVLVVAALVVALLVCQDLAVTVAPPGAGAARSALGHAGSTYLTGLRRFAAYLLWNRLEPQLHEYYGGVPVEKQTYAMPTIAAVIALDPQFDEPYYIAPYVMARRGAVDDALVVAASGVRALPLSGLLHTSYAQILAEYKGDLSAASAQADLALVSDWRSDVERHDAYAILRSVYRRAGQTRKADNILAAIEALDVKLGGALPPGTHDHDGDGKPDH